MSARIQRTCEGGEMNQLPCPAQGGEATSEMMWALFLFAVLPTHPDHHSSPAATGAIPSDAHSFISLPGDHGSSSPRACANCGSARPPLASMGRSRSCLLLAVMGRRLVVGFRAHLLALGSPFTSRGGARALVDLYVSERHFHGWAWATSHRTAAGCGPSSFWIGNRAGLLAVVMGYFLFSTPHFQARSQYLLLPTLDATPGFARPTAGGVCGVRIRGWKSALRFRLMGTMVRVCWRVTSVSAACVISDRRHTIQSWISALTAVLDTSAL